EASALNEIMMEADGDFLVLYEADTIPTINTTSHLVTPLMRDKKIGITFANPIPTSTRGVSPNAWAYLAKFLRMVRRSDGITRLGVTGRGIALRKNVAKESLIPRWVNSATDLYLPCRVLELKYKAKYVDEAAVYFRPDETIHDFCLHVLKAWVGHYRLNRYAKRHLPIKASFLSNFKTFCLVASRYPLEAFSLFLAIISIPMYAPRIIKKVHTPHWAIATSTKRYPLATEDR
ncbi:MAG: glycosyltransferase, partial [Nitrososphaerales archaeon]